MLEDRYEQLKRAEKGAKISIITYIFLAALKVSAGNAAHSSALLADGLNNLTDIISSVTVLVGLRLSRKPADQNHRYGHWKIENVASLIASLIMMYIGGEVFFSAVDSLQQPGGNTTSILAAVIGTFSGLIMLGVYFYNRRLARKTGSTALLAASKDNRNDALISFGTTIAVVAAALGYDWVDAAAAVIVSLMILKTAFEIFKDNFYVLSDGFSEEDLHRYAEAIADIEGIIEVVSIKGRFLGANIYVDVVVTMNDYLSVYDSHLVTEKVEATLHERFGVFETDVHVEPHGA